MARRFELVEGASSKFWEIAVSGSSHTVRFGRIGTNGQEKEKSFASAAEAEADAAKLVREKLGKGYREVGAPPSVEATPAPAPKPAPPRRAKTPAVRTRLESSRGGKRIVALLRGTELVLDGDAVQFESAVLAKNALDALVRAKMKDGYAVASVDIVGDTPPEPEPEIESEPMVPDPKLEQADGFFRITFEDHEAPSEAQCAAVAARIASDAPDALQLICDFASPGEAWPRALADKQLPSVRSIVFDTFFQTQTRQTTNTIGDLRGTLDACPSLERFFATGALSITRGQHAKLRELYVLGNPLSPAFLAGLGTWTFPSLERLVISLASEDHGADTEAVALFAGLVAPQLREVTLDGLDDVASTIDRLVAAGHTRAWKALYLDGSIEADDVVAAVERNAAVLSQLEVFALPSGDLNEDDMEKMQALCSSVRDLADFPSWTLPEQYEHWPAQKT